MSEKQTNNIKIECTDHNNEKNILDNSLNILSLKKEETKTDISKINSREIIITPNITHKISLATQVLILLLCVLCLLVFSYSTIYLANEIRGLNITSFSEHINLLNIELKKINTVGETVKDLIPYLERSNYDGILSNLTNEIKVFNNAIDITEYEEIFKNLTNEMKVFNNAFSDIENTKNFFNYLKSFNDSLVNLNSLLNKNYNLLETNTKIYQSDMLTNDILRNNYLNEENVFSNNNKNSIDSINTNSSEQTYIDNVDINDAKIETPQNNFEQTNININAPF